MNLNKIKKFKFLKFLNFAILSRIKLFLLFLINLQNKMIIKVFSNKMKVFCKQTNYLPSFFSKLGLCMREYYKDLKIINDFGFQKEKKKIGF